MFRLAVLAALALVGVTRVQDRDARALSRLLSPYVNEATQDRSGQPKLP